MNRKRAAILLALVLLLAGLAAYRPALWAERHRPSGAEPFDFERGDYADYLAHERRRLLDARVDETDEYALEGLSPFRLEPAGNCAPPAQGAPPHGVVLVHDLFASPYFLRALAAHLRTRCFLVYGLLLPGHGGRPGDLLRAGRREWREALAFAVRELRREAQSVHLAGDGLGGALAVLQAADDPGIASLMLFNPTFRTLGVSWRARPLALLGRLAPGFAWRALRPDDALFHHESVPYRALAELRSVGEAAADVIAGDSLGRPVFAALSLDDMETDPGATLGLLNALGSEVSVQLYGHSAPLSLRGASVLDPYYPAEGILSLSHFGMTVPPNDDYYGFSGTYRHCGHYAREPEAHGACKRGEHDFHAEALPGYLAQGRVARTTFNLFFYQMLEELDAFLAGTGALERTPEPGQRRVF